MNAFDDDDSMPPLVDNPNPFPAFPPHFSQFPPATLPATATYAFPTDDDGMPPLVENPLPPPNTNTNYTFVNASPPPPPPPTRIFLDPSPSPSVHRPPNPNIAFRTQNANPDPNPNLNPSPLVLDSSKRTFDSAPTFTFTPSPDPLTSPTGPGPHRTSHTKKRDASYIPRPPNAFILFRASFIKAQHISDRVEGNRSELSKIIGKYWHALPRTERALWEAKAQSAQDEHRKKYPDWRFRPGMNVGFGGGGGGGGESKGGKGGGGGKGRKGEGGGGKGKSVAGKGSGGNGKKRIKAGGTAGEPGRAVKIKHDADSEGGLGRRSGGVGAGEGKGEEAEEDRCERIARLLGEGKVGRELERAMGVWDRERVAGVGEVSGQEVKDGKEVGEKVSTARTRDEGESKTKVESDTEIDSKTVVEPRLQTSTVTARSLTPNSTPALIMTHPGVGVFRRSASEPLSLNPRKEPAEIGSSLFSGVSVASPGSSAAESFDELEASSTTGFDYAYGYGFEPEKESVEARRYYYDPGPETWGSGVGYDGISADYNEFGFGGLVETNFNPFRQDFTFSPAGAYPSYPYNTADSNPLSPVDPLSPVSPVSPVPSNANAFESGSSFSPGQISNLSSGSGGQPLPQPPPTQAHPHPFSSYSTLNNWAGDLPLPAPPAPSEEPKYARLPASNSNTLVDGPCFGFPFFNAPYVSPGFGVGNGSG